MHYIKYARICVFSDQYFLIYEQNVDFFSEWDQIRRTLRIWSHLPKKSRLCPYTRNTSQRKPVFWHILHTESGIILETHEQYQITISCRTKAVFRILSNSWDGAFVQNHLIAKKPLTMFPKNLHHKYLTGW